MLTKPRYSRSGNEEIFKELREEVDEMLKSYYPQRKNIIILKAILFPLLYVLVYSVILLYGENLFILYSGYFMLGILLLVIFLNVIHDAVHGTIFKSRSLNILFVCFFDIMGANSFMWKLRHVRFHHNYPNVNGWDTDIEQSPMARIFPTAPLSKMHKYQHLYLPVLYPLYIPNWLLIRDFRDFFDRNKTVRKLIDIPGKEYVKLFVFKIFFFSYMILVPKIILGLSWLVILTGFFVMLFTASIFSLIVLLSPHANTDSEFPVADEEGALPHSWMMHMLKTTNDVHHNNFITRFFMGCFNFHVVHHLFPNVNHVYYPEITGLLKKYARRFNLPYREFSLIHSLKSHYRLLRQNRFAENLFEETM